MNCTQNAVEPVQLLWRNLDMLGGMGDSCWMIWAQCWCLRCSPPRPCSRRAGRARYDLLRELRKGGEGGKHMWLRYHMRVHHTSKIATLFDRVRDLEKWSGCKDQQSLSHSNARVITSSPE